MPTGYYAFSYEPDDTFATSGVKVNLKDTPKASVLSQGAADVSLVVASVTVGLATTAPLIVNCALVAVSSPFPSVTTPSLAPFFVLVSPAAT